MTLAYTVGTTVRLAATFQVDGVNVDPTTVTFKSQAPDKVLTTYVFGIDAELVQDAVGQYHVDFNITQSAHYLYRWEGTGAAQVTAENSFVVEQRAFL